MVISLAVLCAEALVDEIGQSTSRSKAAGRYLKLQGLIAAVDCSHGQSIHQPASILYIQFQRHSLAIRLSARFQ